MNTEEKLFELTQSTILRTRIIIYTSLIVTAFCITQLMYWHWGWHNVAMEVRKRAVERLDTNIANEVATVEALRKLAIDSVDNVKEVVAIDSLNERIRLDSTEKALLEHVWTTLYDQRITSIADIPLIDFSSSTVDLPLLSPCLVIALMLLLALSLRQLAAIINYWNNVLVENNHEMNQKRKLIDMQFFLTGPIFGANSSLIFQLFLGFLVSGQFLFIVSDNSDLKQIYEANELFRPFLGGTYESITFIRQFFLIVGMITIYVLAYLSRAKIVAIRLILEEWKRKA